MRKVWTTKRNGKDGVYVEWYSLEHKRRSKYFQKQYAKYIKPFMTRKFAELNSDVRPIGDVIKVSWSYITDAYLESKKAERLTTGTISDIQNTLRIFYELCQPADTGQITSDMVDKFKVEVKSNLNKKTTKKVKHISPNTLNKHLRNLKAFFSFTESKGWTKKIDIKSVRAEPKRVNILSDKDIRELLLAAQSKQWRLKILIAVCTGLRVSDIESLDIKDLDFERKTISIVNKKTKKITNHQPLPDALMPELQRFMMEEVDDGQVKLFKIRFCYRRWNKIKAMAGLPNIEFHDLRRTFGSMQADAGVPIKALQEMYNHSSIETTMKHYIKTGESEKRDGVNKLKVAEWF